MRSLSALTSLVLTFFAVFAAVIVLTMGGIQTHAPATAEVVVDSDLQILDVGGIYGGHITWTITGPAAHELRELIGDKYGVSHIDLAVASKYFKGNLEPVVEDNKFDCGYLGFVRIQHSDPLHGDTNGILNDESDIQGLIGSVDSSKPITLNMLIRGEPVSGTWPVVSHNLTLAPFYALASSQADIEKMGLDNITIETQHREILAGFGSLLVPDGTFRTRLILGEFFMASGGWVAYSTFSVFNSPLILFLVYAGMAYGLGRMNYMLVGDKTGTLMDKRARLYVNVMRVTALFAYLLLPLGGIWLIMLLAAMLGVSYPVLRKIYRL